MKKLSALALAATSAALALVAFPSTSASQPVPVKRGLPGPSTPSRLAGPAPASPVGPSRLGSVIIARHIPPIALTGATRAIQTVTDLNGQTYGAGPKLIAQIGEDGKVGKTFPTTIARASISPHGTGALVVGDLTNKTISLFDARSGAIKPLFGLAGIMDSSRDKSPGGHLLQDGKLAAVASDGNHIYVAMEAGFSSAIFKIDPATKRIVERGWVSAGDPTAMVHENGALFVLVGNGSQVRRFTPALQRSKDNIDLPAAGATGIGIRGVEIRTLTSGQIARATVAASELSASTILATIERPVLIPAKTRPRTFPRLNVPKRYAVLITGDLAENFWGECFWNDTVWLYKTLLSNGYAAEDIFVLYGDGADYASPNAAYQHPSRVTDFAATSGNVNAVLDGLKSGDAARGIPKMDTNDTLFMWTFDHGGRSGTESTLCLRDGCMLASAFSAKANAIEYQQRAIFMQQCFSGGFIPLLQNNKTYISTAARFDEVARPADTENEVVGGRTYSHGEYDYWITSALNRLTPVGAAVNADTSADTYLSMAELHAWNAGHESLPETPQMNDMGGVGALFKMKK